MRCRCVRVEVFEHENNSAIYESYPEQKPESTSEPVQENYSTIEGVIRQSTNNPIVDDSKDKEVKPKDTNNVDQQQSFNKHGQQKTVGKWVDPKYKGKTKNTWLF